MMWNENVSDEKKKIPNRFCIFMRENVRGNTCVLFVHLAFLDDCLVQFMNRLIPFTCAAQWESCTIYMGLIHVEVNRLSIYYACFKT